MPTKQELAREAMDALAIGDFEALYEIGQLAGELGHPDLKDHVDFIIETVVESDGSEV